MPEIIIEQSQEVINYINMLKLPISEDMMSEPVHISPNYFCSLFSNETGYGLMEDREKAATG